MTGAVIRKGGMQFGIPVFDAQEHKTHKFGQHFHAVQIISYNEIIIDMLHQVGKGIKKCIQMFALSITADLISAVRKSVIYTMEY